MFKKVIYTSMIAFLFAISANDNAISSKRNDMIELQQPGVYEGLLRSMQDDWGAESRTLIAAIKEGQGKATTLASEFEREFASITLDGRALLGLSATEKEEEEGGTTAPATLFPLEMFKAQQELIRKMRVSLQMSRELYIGSIKKEDDKRFIAARQFDLVGHKYGPRLAALALFTEATPKELGWIATYHVKKEEAEFKQLKKGSPKKKDGKEARDEHDRLVQEQKERVARLQKAGKDAKKGYFNAFKDEVKQGVELVAEALGEESSEDTTSSKAE